jgi:hypothetical protein
MPISLEVSTINQSASNLQAVISGKNQEIQGAIATVRNQGTRQLVTNGDSQGRDVRLRDLREHPADRRGLGGHRVRVPVDRP